MAAIDSALVPMDGSPLSERALTVALTDPGTVTETVVYRSPVRVLLVR